MPDECGGEDLQINTSTPLSQRLDVPGFPSCVEYSSRVWEKIHAAKSRKSDLHVVWLDLAKAYVFGTPTAHQLLSQLLPHTTMHPESHNQVLWQIPCPQLYPDKNNWQALAAERDCDELHPASPLLLDALRLPSLIVSQSKKEPQQLLC